MTVAATDRTTFDFANGWDFGDRVAYSCAWVEFYQGQNEEFEVAYHAVGDYSGHLEINDMYGAESPDTDALPALCLQDSGVTQPSDFRFEGGSGQFPHGTDLVFYRAAPGVGAQARRASR